MLKTITTIAAFAALTATFIAPAQAAITGNAITGNSLTTNSLTTNAVHPNSLTTNGHDAGGSSLSIQAIELPPETR